MRRDTVINYQIKTINNDFSVTEIADLDLSGGEYSVYFLHKSGLRTSDTVKLISEKTGISVSEISYSGLKDEDAIASQYIAVYNGRFHELSYSDEFGNFFELSYIGTSPRKMEIGDLYGNAFDIRIRNLDSINAQKVFNGAKRLINVINYYGIQRFGMPDKPELTYLIGKKLLDTKYGEMAEYLLESGSITHTQYAQWLADPQKMLKKSDVRELSFYLNSWDSYLWNCKISYAISMTNKHMGIRNISGFEYIYTMVDNEIESILTDIPILRHKLNSDLVVKEYCSYRQPIIPVIYRSSDILPDDLNSDKVMIDIKFMLPSGAYATTVVDQLIWYLCSKS